MALEQKTKKILIGVGLSILTISSAITGFVLYKRFKKPIDPVVGTGTTGNSGNVVTSGSGNATTNSVTPIALDSDWEEAYDSAKSRINLKLNNAKVLLGMGLIPQFTNGQAGVILRQMENINYNKSRRSITKHNAMQEHRELKLQIIAEAWKTVQSTIGITLEEILKTSVYTIQ